MILNPSEKSKNLLVTLIIAVTAVVLLSIVFSSYDYTTSDEYKWQTEGRPFMNKIKVFIEMRRIEWKADPNKMPEFPWRGMLAFLGSK
jgi:hypothetical protein